MLGRTPRVVPTNNLGNFVRAVPITLVVGSYSVNPGLSRVPVSNNNKRMVTSKTPKFPTLSEKHKLTVYISSQTIQGLPKQIEEVYRDDLNLKMLFSMIEYELCHIEVSCKLSFIVIDFAISKDCNVGWHKAMLSRIVDLVRSHLTGNMVRFGEMWCTPDLTIPDTLMSFHKPSHNYFPCTGFSIS